MQRDISNDVGRNKIHIAAIQETHIAQDREYEIDNYRATTATEPRKKPHESHKEQHPF